MPLLSDKTRNVNFLTGLFTYSSFPGDIPTDAEGAPEDRHNGDTITRTNQAKNEKTGRTGEEVQ